MINAGDTIVNPVTGERIVFHKTSASTNGECVEIEVFVQPGGVVAAAHVHPNQTERFEILGGTIGMKVGRKKIEARYGDVLTVEPGTRTSSGTPATTSSTSSASSAPLSSSSSCSRRCSRSPPTARRTGRACRTRCGSP